MNTILLTIPTSGAPASAYMIETYTAYVSGGVGAPSWSLCGYGPMISTSTTTLFEVLPSPAYNTYGYRFADFNLNPLTAIVTIAPS